jgi:hypothetical protein
MLLVGQDEQYVFGFWLLTLGQDTPVQKARAQRRGSTRPKPDKIPTVDKEI